MNINQLLNSIPEELFDYDEALMAIDGWVVNPCSNSARVSPHLSNKFRMDIKIDGEIVFINAESRQQVVCHESDFLTALKREIYETDEAISAGQCKIVMKPLHGDIYPDDRPAPPEHMDIPVWDETQGEWYDAEY